jgi:hypothetical protein
VPVAEATGTPAVTGPPVPEAAQAADATLVCMRNTEAGRDRLPGSPVPGRVVGLPPNEES